MTDKIKIGKVKIAFCPTHDMIGDFFMKPVQGALFARMHATILNLPGRTECTMHRRVLEN